MRLLLELQTFISVIQTHISNQPAQVILCLGATSSTNCVTVTDAVAHEFTHGVLLSAANLAVDGQSAALHESISDAFGSAVEAYVNGGINEYTWTVGEGIYPGHSSALRSMARPADFGSPDHISNTSSYCNFKWFNKLPWA